MRHKFISKFLVVCLAVILISGTMAGCGPKNSNPPLQTAPNEKSIDYTYDNNRANHNNFGIIAEDLNYIFYKNISDTSALYRLDKKTGEKLKLADIDQSIIAYLSVWEDKLYYVAVQNVQAQVQASQMQTKMPTQSSQIPQSSPTPLSSQPPATSRPNPGMPTTALYSVGKDGSNPTKLIDNVFECFVANGDVYYISLGTDSSNALRNINKYSLLSGTTETLVEGMVTNINMNNAGTKLYYIKMNTTPSATVGISATASSARVSMMDVVEFDIGKKEEKVILLAPAASPTLSPTASPTSKAKGTTAPASNYTPVIPNATSGFGNTAPPSGGGGNSSIITTSYLNYYDGSLYYVENRLSIKKYNLATDEITLISKNTQAGAGSISAMAVSRLGIFYTVNQNKQWSLYNVADGVPVVVTTIPATTGGENLFLALVSEYILLVNDYGSANTGFIKAFTIKGEEVTPGF